MSTPTPETLRALVEKWRNAVVAKRDMDFNGRARNHESDWFVLQQCADELAALLDTAREEKPDA